MVMTMIIMIIILNRSRPAHLLLCTTTIFSSGIFTAIVSFVEDSALALLPTTPSAIGGTVAANQAAPGSGRVGSVADSGMGGEGGLAVQTKSAVQQLETLALQPVVFRQHRQFLGSARCHFPRTQLSPPSTPPQGGREGWGDVRVMVVVVLVGGVGGVKIPEESVDAGHLSHLLFLQQVKLRD